MSRWITGLVLGLLAALYAAVYFPGLEATTTYSGFAYKLVHPDSFPGDPYMNTDPPAWLQRLPAPIARIAAPFASENPTFLSLQTPLVQLFGELWLDDRVAFLIYAGLALLAMWGVERIAALCGLSPLERLAVVAVLAVDHCYKEHLVQLVSSANFNPTALAYAPAIWLAYATLARKPIPVIAGLGLLTALMSVKTGWFPVLVAGALTLHDRFGVSWKRLAITAAAGLAILFAGYALTHGANVEQARYFDLIHFTAELGEADPFLEAGPGNVMYLALLLIGLRLRLASPELTARLRAVWALSLLVFVGGALYYRFSPTPLKIPLFLALGVNRSTWWTALLLWLVLAAVGVRALREPSPRARLAGWALLAAVFGMPWLRYPMWDLHPSAVKRAAAAGVALGLALLGRAVWQRLRRGAAPIPWHTVATASWVLAIGIILGGLTLRRAPALAYLARHGVIGDAATAKWVGVNEYIREQTPPEASVLTLVTRDLPWRPEGLRTDGSLRTRTGRRMPIGMELSIWRNPEKVRWHRQQEARIQALLAAWERQDPAEALAALTALGLPDYLVVAASRTQWLDGQRALPYHPVKAIGEFVIFQRSQTHTAHKEQTS
jgi:hypothetical protein